MAILKTLLKLIFSLLIQTILLLPKLTLFILKSTKSLLNVFIKTIECFIYQTEIEAFQKTNI